MYGGYRNFGRGCGYFTVGVSTVPFPLVAASFRLISSKSSTSSFSALFSFLFPAFTAVVFAFTIVLLTPPTTSLALFFRLCFLPPLGVLTLSVYGRMFF